jgi:hypothetical protein
MKFLLRRRTVKRSVFHNKAICPAVLMKFQCQSVNTGGQKLSAPDTIAPCSMIARKGQISGELARPGIVTLSVC